MRLLALHSVADGFVGKLQKMSIKLYNIFIFRLALALNEHGLK